MGKFLLLLSVGVPVVGTVSSVPLNVIPPRHLSYAVERAQGVRIRRRTVLDVIIIFLQQLPRYRDSLKGSSSKMSS